MPIATFPDSGWPPGVVRGVCAVPSAIAAVVIAQRGTVDLAGVLVVFAAVPWAMFGWTGRAVPWSAILMLTWVAGLAVLADPVPYDVGPLLVVFVAAVFAATNDARKSLLVVAVSVCLLVGVDLAGRFSGSAIWVLGVTMAWFAGFSFRLQEVAHSATAARAAAEERERISIELHDVVAHSLAVTMLHLTGARLALARDPASAESALLQAEECGRQSMAVIRRVVGKTSVAATAEPVPAAEDLDDLVAEYVLAGLPVGLCVDGDLRTVPAVTGLVLYRIAQQSLANVVKHAPGSGAEVAATVEPNVVHLSVCNELARAGDTRRGRGGSGIIGMAERSASVGGTLVAGPRAGRWCVTVDLPMDAAG